MNNKGYVFGIGLMLGVTISLLFLYTQVESNSSPEEIGSLQTEFYNAAFHVQERMMFYDGFVKEGTINGIYATAKKGGFFEESPCGDYYGVERWSGKNIESEYADCSPKYREQLALSFTHETDQLLESLGQKIDYSFFVAGDENFSVSAIALDVVTERLEEHRWYADRPSSTVTYNYGNEHYVKISSIIASVNEECSGYEDIAGERLLSDCVQREVSSHDGYELLNVADLNIPAEEKAVNRMQEYLQAVSLTNYDACFYTQNSIDFWDDENVPQIMQTFGSVSMYDGEEFNFQIGVIEGNGDTPLPSVVDTVTYIPEKNSIISNALGEEKLDKISLYKLANSVGFIDRADATKYKEFSPGRDCAYEDRSFIIQTTQNEIYPEKGELNYVASFLVDDHVAPAISGVEIKDKGFDQESVLIFWDHTASLDLESYTLFVNGEEEITFTPWLGMEFRETFEEKGDSLRDACIIGPIEGTEFFNCAYLIDGDLEFLKDTLYYFSNDNRFMYVKQGVSDGSVTAQVKVVDDEGNERESELASGMSLDDLPLKMVPYSLSPVIVDTTTGSYVTIRVGPMPLATSHMNGKENNDLDFSYYLVPHANLKIGRTILSAIDLRSGSEPIAIGSIQVPTTYTLIYSDPSLKDFPIDLKRMKYKCNVIENIVGRPVDC